MMVIFPTCSELVFHTTASTETQIKTVLRALVDMGLRIRLESPRFLWRFAPLLTKNYFSRLLDVDIDDIVVSGSDIGVPIDRLPERLRTVYSLELDESKIVRLLLYNPEDRKVALYIDVGDGYCFTNTLTFKCTDHSCKDEFKLLCTLLENIRGRYESHDGGSTFYFDAWLERRGKGYLRNRQ